MHFLVDGALKAAGAARLVNALAAGDQERTMKTDELPRIAHDPAAFERSTASTSTPSCGSSRAGSMDPHLAADLTPWCSSRRSTAPPATPGPRRARRLLIGHRAQRDVVRVARAGPRAARARPDPRRRLLDDDDIARIQERIDAPGAGPRPACRDRRPADGERAVFELIALDGLTTRGCRGPRHPQRHCARAACIARATPCAASSSTTTRPR